jgi:hypothetical protein
LPSSSAASLPSLHNVVFLDNDTDGPVIDPTLPDPLSTP